MTDWFSECLQVARSTVAWRYPYDAYRLESALTMAAVIGFGRRPQLLAGLLVEVSFRPLIDRPVKKEPSLRNHAFNDSPAVDRSDK